MGEGRISLSPVLPGTGKVPCAELDPRTEQDLAPGHRARQERPLISRGFALTANPSYGKSRNTGKRLAVRVDSHPKPGKRGWICKALQRLGLSPSPGVPTGGCAPRFAPAGPGSRPAMAGGAGGGRRGWGCLAGPRILQAWAGGAPGPARRGGREGGSPGPLPGHSPRRAGLLPPYAAAAARRPPPRGSRAVGRLRQGERGGEGLVPRLCNMSPSAEQPSRAGGLRGRGLRTGWQKHSNPRRFWAQDQAARLFALIWHPREHRGASKLPSP